MRCCWPPAGAADDWEGCGCGRMVSAVDERARWAERHSYPGRRATRVQTCAVAGPPLEQQTARRGASEARAGSSGASAAARSLGGVLCGLRPRARAGHPRSSSQPGSASSAGLHNLQRVAPPLRRLERLDARTPTVTPPRVCAHFEHPFAQPSNGPLDRSPSGRAPPLDTTLISQRNFNVSRRLAISVPVASPSSLFSTPLP